MAEFSRVVDAARGAIEIQKELKTRNAELPENRRIGFLRPQNTVLLALGFIGTFPNSIEEYNHKSGLTLSHSASLSTSLNT